MTTVHSRKEFNVLILECRNSIHSANNQPSNQFCSRFGRGQIKREHMYFDTLISERTSQSVNRITVGFCKRSAEIYT